MKRVGVLAVQGDVSEHLAAVARAGESRGERAEAVPVRRAGTLEGLRALILPGGESTSRSADARKKARWRSLAPAPG